MKRLSKYYDNNELVFFYGWKVTCHRSVPVRFKSQRPAHRHFHINKAESGAAGILLFYVVQLHFRIKIQTLVHVRAGLYCTNERGVKSCYVKGHF